MSDPTIQEALKLFKREVPAPAMTEYEIEQQAFRRNYERLKAERLAREAKLEGDKSV
jgi:phosphopantothenoylcysteine synthetase/decarboxylase